MFSRGFSATKRLLTTTPVWKRALAVGGVSLGGLTLGAATVAAEEDCIHPPHQHWPHKGFFSAFDTAALRRGYEVYRQVCSTCHSMNILTFRNLIGFTHTEEQAKALAASYTIMDGPDANGEMFERPRKLSDPFPAPYPNEETARAINNGAYPVDLSCVSKARHGGEDYIFALLTGYSDPPAGVQLRDGLYYNRYFPGGAIAMAKALNDEGVEYEDGTPATECQMARDVSTFLAWASEPESDERKKSGLKWIVALAAMTVFAGYNKRRVWSVLKTEKLSYRSAEPYKVYRK